MSPWALIGAGARGTVASALVLSALWKVRNRDGFRASFARNAPSFMQRHARAFGTALVVFEVFLGVGIIWPIESVVRASSIGVIALIGTLTLVMIRRGDLRDGCGCWRAPTSDVDARSAFVSRNTILILAAACGVLAPTAIDLGGRLLSLSVGAALGLIVLEIPTFASVLSGVAPRGEGVHR